MTMQINVEPSKLTQEQREAVAGFILAYPNAEQKFPCGTLTAEVKVDTKSAESALDALSEKLERLNRSSQLCVEPVSGELAVGDTVATDTENVSYKIIATTEDSSVNDDPAIAFGKPVASLKYVTVTPPLTSTASITNDGTISLSVPAAIPEYEPVSVSVPTSSVELDSQGLPWDMRIHSTNKAKIADGSWRKRRGVEASMVTMVEGELRMIMGIPSPSPAVVRPVAVSGVLMSDGSINNAPVAPAAPAVAPAAPAVAPMPPIPSFLDRSAETPVPDDRGNFVKLIGRTSAALQTAKITQAEVTQICLESGVPALPLLANRLDLVPMISGKIDALIAARQ